MVTMVLLVGVIIWTAYSVVMLFRIPVREPQVAEETAGEAPAGQYAEAVVAERPALVETLGRRAESRAAASASRTNAPSAIPLSPEAHRSHMQIQGSILRKELLSSTGPDNGLTATEEEIADMERDGAVVY